VSAIAPFELSGCVGTSQLEGAAELPRLAVPPRADMTDHVAPVVRPSRSIEQQVEWQRYSGQFRVGYQRWGVERGEPRQLPSARTVSSPFHLLPPG